MRKPKMIIRNKIKCRKCGDIIESYHCHDYKHCKCGLVAVDGGREYLKREFPKFPTEEWYEELSIVEKEESNEQKPDLHSRKKH